MAVIMTAAERPMPTTTRGHKSEKTAEWRSAFLSMYKGDSFEELYQNAAQLKSLQAGLYMTAKQAKITILTGSYPDKDSAGNKLETGKLIVWRKDGNMRPEGSKLSVVA